MPPKTKKVVPEKAEKQEKTGPEKKTSPEKLEKKTNPEKKTSPEKPEKPEKPGPVLVSQGAGMTAGLEIWRFHQRLLLVDRSTDSRFATDVAEWNAAVGLNAVALKRVKDAAK
jgi:hypothetical protein